MSRGMLKWGSIVKLAQSQAPKATQDDCELIKLRKFLFSSFPLSLNLSESRKKGNQKFPKQNFHILMKTEKHLS